jgi:dienelactone hydrolase
MRRLLRALLAMTIIVLMCTSTAAVAAATSDYETLDDQRYGPHGARNQADVYLPTFDASDDDPRGVLVLIHGGGFTAGNEDGMRPIAERYVARGYVVVSGTYRYATDRGTDIEPCWRDTVALLRWVRQQAPDWGGDGGRIVVLGSSAGASLASLAATRPDARPGVGVKPLAIVTLSAPTRLWRTSQSPITWAGRGDAPVLSVHATDELIPLRDQTTFVRALRRANVRGIETITLDSRAHGIALWPAVADRTDLFIDRWLQ